MITSKNGIDLITQFEGFSSKPYKCPAGLPTIGYGHQILSGEVFTEITKDQGIELLKKDLRERELKLNKLELNLTQNNFDALISFIYNIGFGAFLRSTMYKLLKEGKVGLAADEFLKYVFSKQVKLPGLVRRRQSERLLFLGGNND